MLSNANLPKSFWAEAASTAYFLINQSPSVAIEKKTPQEVWPGNPADFSDLKIFGCPVYAHVDNEKLEPRSIKCVFLGYKAGVKRTRRETKPLRKYAEADLVAYALNVVEDIDANQEPSNYSEASPAQWYKRFDSFMTSYDFKRSSFENCVYFKKNSDGSFVYLLLYVDDMLIAAKDKGEIRTVKAQLSEEIEMKDLGPAKKILGMKILRDRKSDDKIEYMSHVPFSSAVGSLMYAMVCSCPNLSCAVSAISRYMPNPGKEHWKAVQWILRYLQDTTDVCLQFGRTRDEVIGYVDADFARDLDRRRSLIGYVFTIGGCTISWKATLQNTITLSTTEAEYIAIIEACKEAI
ncbi:hypothetical protein CXB51_009219 [Gossypium anomalum]|uniref:Reverse transcriptase Ty1/copia-type domain-containing protein n=1 Tax=Gossypium anomalum TaxID=47600 RepID=A0A8J6D5Y7_9ROSI|nr:hypothetical protein CXB51_009219 [Gossypium anomalum]